VSAAAVVQVAWAAGTAPARVRPSALTPAVSVETAVLAVMAAAAAADVVARFTGCSSMERLPVLPTPTRPPASCIQGQDQAEREGSVADLWACLELTAPPELQPSPTCDTTYDVI
jgi:hypothetical protein